LALRQVSTHAEMLSAVRLCEDAFNAAEIDMGEHFWRYGSDGDHPTADVQEMPYTEATACHAEMLSAGRVPMRQYYLYQEHGSASPSAAIIVEALCTAVWIVGLMGSCHPGHGRQALAELQALAFAPGKGLELVLSKISISCTMFSVTCFREGPPRPISVQPPTLVQWCSTASSMRRPTDTSIC
jgi:hypothetical protein